MTSHGKRDIILFTRLGERATDPESEYYRLWCRHEPDSPGLIEYCVPDTNNRLLVLHTAALEEKVLEQGQMSADPEHLYEAITEVLSGCRRDAHCLFLFHIRNVTRYMPPFKMNIHRDWVLQGIPAVVDRYSSAGPFRLMYQNVLMRLGEAIQAGDAKGGDVQARDVQKLYSELWERYLGTPDIELFDEFITTCKAAGCFDGAAFNPKFTKILNIRLANGSTVREYIEECMINADNSESGSLSFRKQLGELKSLILEQLLK